MIYSVQFLRFVAASAVLIAHAMTELGQHRIGTFGVDIFFVLSGFIIMYVTQSDARHFMAKRLIRIAPLYYVLTLLLVVVAVAAPNLLNGTAFSWSHLLTSLAFLPAIDQEGTGPILALGWTLNYEMYFYVLFAIAMRISHRWRDIVTTAFLAAVWALGQIVDLPVFLQFYANPIVFEFCFGMAAMRLLAADKIEQPVAIAALSAVAILVAMILIQAMVGRDINRTLIFGPLAALLLINFLALEPIFKGRRWAVEFGNSSYCTYLVHIYLIAVAHRVLGFDGFGQSWLFVLVLAIAATTAGWVTYKLFENPSRRLLTRAYVQWADRPKNSADDKAIMGTSRA